MSQRDELVDFLVDLLLEGMARRKERGFLGEPIGNGKFKFESTTREGRIRVRLMRNDQIYSIVDAINYSVPRDPRIRVLVGKNADGEYEVEGPDPRYIAENLTLMPGVGVGPHSHRLGFGLVDMVEEARFEPAQVVWHSASLFVRVLPFYHIHNGVHQYIPETAVSVASAVPATTGTYGWAKVCYNPEEMSFEVIAGPESTPASLTEATLAAIETPALLPLAGVKLKAGQTEILDGADFMPCHAYFGGDDGGSGSTGEPVTYCGSPVWYNGEQVFYNP